MESWTWTWSPGPFTVHSSQFAVHTMAVNRQVVTVVGQIPAPGAAAYLDICIPVRGQSLFLLAALDSFLLSFFRCLPRTSSFFCSRGSVDGSQLVFVLSAVQSFRLLRLDCCCFVYLSLLSTPIPSLSLYCWLFLACSYFFLACPLLYRDARHWNFPSPTIQSLSIPETIRSLCAGL